MEWKIALQTKIRDFEPGTASANRLKRKNELKNALIKKIGKKHQKILKFVIGKEVFIDVCFYLYQSEELSSAKKDLDNLLKIVLDVLSVNMVNGQEKKPGLGFLKDDSDVFRINCEKKIVNNLGKSGLDLKIFYK